MSSSLDFESFYNVQLQERWPPLRSALLGPELKIDRPTLGGQSYRIDQASIWVAESLGTQPGERILDLCAAPGGKSLILIEKLDLGRNERSRIALNEMSRDRFHKMRAVIEQHVPAEIFQRVEFFNKDGSTLGLKIHNEFDRILVDAPCSSERHVLQSPEHLNAWKRSRTKGLAIRQYALLASAFEMLKPGGTLVYSTCALLDLENDEIIEKLLTRKTEAAECLTAQFSFGRKNPARMAFLAGPLQWSGAAFSFQTHETDVASLTNPLTFSALNWINRAELNPRIVRWRDCE